MVTLTNITSLLFNHSSLISTYSLSCSLIKELKDERKRKKVRDYRRIFVECAPRYETFFELRAIDLA